ncbi:MAG TPA: ABC transporter ATP-binding protein [Candidatus Moranbacteria bacterium]|nr:ABC transporter ATP-binding protein [Candidatus Moranbacteria bacterium]
MEEKEIKIENSPWNIYGNGPKKDVKNEAGNEDKNKNMPESGTNSRPFGSAPGAAEPFAPRVSSHSSSHLHADNSGAEAEMKGSDVKKPIIEVQDLNVIYNQGKSNEVRALENVSVTIDPQEYVIIFGPSGCGKSTLLYAISGLQGPTSGMIKVDDEDIAGYKKKQMAEFHQKKIGMVFQAFHLINSITVKDNVCLPKVFRSEKEDARNQKSTTLLERFNILNQGDKFPVELSGGQKQRVSIARALVNDPDIILADEPVGNLDSKSAHNVMTILKELNEVDKKTVVLVTHDPSHLVYGNKIIHMKDGKVVKIEIVRRKEMAKTEQDEGSFIFKDGKVREEFRRMGLVKEEFIPADIKLLIKAFKDLNINQVGALIVPFKADQLFSHVFFSITNEQMETAKKRLQDYMYGRLEFDKFEEELDIPPEKGGAGWDKRIAEKFSLNVKRIIDEANKIDFSRKTQSAAKLGDYLSSYFGLKLEQGKKDKMDKLILDRLENRIGVDEFTKFLDMPEKKNGLDFNKKMAQKIARELEMLLLIRYSA